ncbi:MAG TPA: hypothetical protein VGC39_06710 [Candidatus Methylacidiphilales bacterium]
MTINKIFKWALLGFTFGVISGYLGELVSHHIASLPYTGIDDPWYWWLALPSLPGDALVFRIFNLSDSYLDDEWDYRLPVSIFNGLQWMIVFGFSYFISGLYRNWKKAKLNNHVR